MNALREIANEHGTILIEDAAEAIGARFHGACAGSMGRFGTFSFHGTKTLTTGEGDMTRKTAWANARTRSKNFQRQL